MAWATAADVGTRLRRTLTSEETAAADAVISDVQGLVADAVGKDADWADNLEPVPVTLRVLAIEKALDAITNPGRVASTSEQLGVYQHSTTYPRPDRLVYLTETEERRVRRVVLGAASASIAVKSTLQDAVQSGWPSTLLDDDEPLDPSGVLNLPHPETQEG